MYNSCFLRTTFFMHIQEESKIHKRFHNMYCYIKIQKKLHFHDINSLNSLFQSFLYKYINEFLLYFDHRLLTFYVLYPINTFPPSTDDVSNVGYTLFNRNLLAGFKSTLLLKLKIKCAIRLILHRFLPP